MADTSPITTSNSSIIIELSKLSKDKIYELFGEVAKWLNLDDSDHNQHINPDGVIDEINNMRDIFDHRHDTLAALSFLELDIDIQRSIATDALNNAISLFANVCPSLGYIDDLAEDEIDMAAEEKIQDIYTTAAHDVISAFR